MIQIMYSILFYTALILGANCEKNVGENDEKLVGATDASVGEFPYQASIRANGQHFCGGSLITKKHVLTAGHCVPSLNNTDLSTISVVVGTNSLSKGGATYGVEALSHHPNFTFKVDWVHDIGVLTLNSEVELSNLVDLVKLPNEAVRVGDQAVVSGWGTTNKAALLPSDSLEKLTVKIISLEDCNKILSVASRTADPADICTFLQTGKGACKGDSGGPLTANGQVIGVVSGGIPCAQGFPDIFTDVYKHLPYINEIIGQS